jgi:hypothetical protein
MKRAQKGRVWYDLYVKSAAKDLLLLIIIKMIKHSTGGLATIVQITDLTVCQNGSCPGID